jgi:hypothetical protein
MNSYLNLPLLLLVTLAFPAATASQTKADSKWEEIARTKSETHYIKENGLEGSREGTRRVRVKSVPITDSAEGKQARAEQIEMLMRIKRENPEYIHGDPQQFSYVETLDEVDCKSRKWRPLIQYAYSADGAAIYKYSTEKRPPDWSQPSRTSVMGMIIEDVCKSVGKP